MRPIALAALAALILAPAIALAQAASISPAPFAGGTSGSGSACLTTNCVLVTPTVNSVTDGTSLTLTDTTNSVSSVFKFATAFNGTTSELVLQSNLAFKNVVSFQNLSVQGDSAFTCRDNTGEEHCGVGWGNASNGSPFQGAVFIESSNLGDISSAPPPIRLIQTGVLPGLSYGSNTRVEIDGSGNINLSLQSTSTSVHVLSAALFTGTMLGIMENTNSASDEAWQAKNDAGNTAAVGIFGSTRSNFGVLTTGNGYLYTKTAAFNVVDDNASGVINFGTGSSGGTLRGHIDSNGITLDSGTYNSGASVGVTCSGAPSGSFASTKGIVTHC